MKLRELADLRVGDVAVFLTVARCGKVQGAARELEIPPSQVSKAVARLEGELKVTLLVRSSRGVTLSEAARELLPRLQELVAQVQRLGRRERETIALTIAAPSYLADVFIPVIAAAQPEVRIRALQLAPPILRSLAADNLFDACLTIGRQPLPETWASEKVGELRRALFASPALAARLGRGPIAAEDLAELPFVVPVYTLNGEYVPIDDGCPLPVSARVRGHEAQVIGLGLALAARTDQLVFGPTIAARDHVARGTLVEVAVTGWDRTEELFLACSVDRVWQGQRRAIIDAVRAALAEVRRPGSGLVVRARFP